MKTYTTTNLFEIITPSGISNEARFSLSMEDGSQLPNWVSINEEKGNIIFYKPIEAKTYRFVITAMSILDSNVTKSNIITVEVTKGINWWIWVM